MLLSSRRRREAAMRRRCAVMRRRAGLVPGVLFCGGCAIMPGFYFTVNGSPEPGLKHLPSNRLNERRRSETMPREINWSDTLEIAIQLQEKFPDLDPYTVRFTDMHKWITELP